MYCVQMECAAFPQAVLCIDALCTIYQCIMYQKMSECIYPFIQLIVNVDIDVFKTNSECIYPCIQRIVNVNIDVFWTNSECIYPCIQQIVNVNIDVF